MNVSGMAFKVQKAITTAGPGGVDDAGLRVRFGS